MDHRFSYIISLIQGARAEALRAVNRELISLYWDIGAYISEQIAAAEWGDGVVKELAVQIQKTEPGLRGFSGKNLWRMKPFYETYQASPKRSPLVREISWTHNLLILSRTRLPEEREFYLRLCKAEGYTKRELDRQISASLFERTMLGNAVPPLKGAGFPAEAAAVFRDSYVFDFLALPEPQAEKDLHRGLVLQMKRLILELGKDFLFVDSEHRLQVGNRDFFTDLLFYHRGLQCLVAFS